MYETAGAIGKGEKVFITAKMPNFIKIDGVKDDITEIYVLLTSTHDGTGAIIAAITPVRVVCQNTLNAALKSTINRVYVRHTNNVKSRLEDAHRLLGISHKFIAEASDCFNMLAKKPMMDDQVKQLIENVFRTEKEDSTRIKNIREAVWVAYNTGTGQDDILGTAWGAYNGLAYYLDHVKEYRSDETKFDAILTGNAQNILSEGLMELVKV